MFWTVAAIYLLALVERSSTSAAADPPHIIIILADDLGWNDVSFHGSNQFQTPNIDALAYSGVILQDYYTQPICTPARAALLTGRHPISNGMEHDVIYAPEPWGLPLKEKLLPQYLKSLGYVSRAVGKWHLGFYKAAYTPTRRGFDSHFGTWLGHGNHFTYMSYENSPGYDLHRDRNIAWKGQGKFSADLFTEEAEAVIRDHNVSKPLFLYLAHTAPHAPFQAPQETIASLRHVPGVKRRTYAAMVTKVDESVGKVVQELKIKDMLNNSIVLFLTDNGGEINGNNGNVASNWPLKGGKNTLWEGGVRGVGLIWSPLLKATPRVHRGLVSVQDWLPTLLEAAGATSNTFDMSQLDGVSQWTALNNQSKPPYTTMLHNIDPIWNVAAIRKGKWKLSTGRTRGGRYDGWFGRVRSSSDTYNVDHVRDSLAGRAVQSTTQPLPSEANILGLRNQATISCNPPTDKHARKGEMCRPQRSPCLFDIVTDPCEHRNVAKRHPKVVARLTALLEQFQPVKPCNKPLDPRSYPRHWNYTWTTWRDYV